MLVEPFVNNYVKFNSNSGWACTDDGWCEVRLQTGCQPVLHSQRPTCWRPTSAPTVSLYGKHAASLPGRLPLLKHFHLGHFVQQIPTLSAGTAAITASKPCVAVDSLLLVHCVMHAQVMQALSHFSYHKSGGHLVLCDLQGGILPRRGAVLTGQALLTAVWLFG
jgi:hypothetical protein